jgi:hypothetical protein
MENAMHKKLVLAGVLAAVLSGCATTVHYPEESRADWEYCVAWVDSDPSYGIGPLAQIARNMAYDHCMRERDWVKTGPNT